MKGTLQDLAAHLRWADAVTAGALRKCPAAQADPDVLERLFHTAWVAGAFARLLRGEPAGMPPEARPTFPEVMVQLREAGNQLQGWIDAAPAEAFETTVHVPWFQDPPLHLRRKDALLQALLHTQHHRGQTMTRLKQLGCSAKNVDFIIWVWKGRPGPLWPD